MQVSTLVVLLKPTIIKVKKKKHRKFWTKVKNALKGKVAYEFIFGKIPPFT